MASSDSKPVISTSLAEYRIDWNDKPNEIAEQDRIMLLDLNLRATVYEQKYQMMRHFDSLRWQIPGLVFAVGGALFGFAPKLPTGLPHYLALGTYGAFALVGSYTMYRIRHNLRLNNRILRRFAISLDDFGILRDPGIKSASTWMHVLLVMVGVASLIMCVVGFLYR